MALINELDRVAAAERLAAWLPTKLDGATDVRVFDVDIPSSNGMSMVTVLFRASWIEGGGKKEHAYAARVAPPVPLIFHDSDLTREFAVLDALHRAGLPVPRPHWLETNVKVLGGTFLVMDRVDGLIPSDDPPHTKIGWVLDLPAGRRGDLYRNTVEFIAQLQAVDWRAAGLESLDRPEYGNTGLEQQLNYWQRYYEWTHGGRPSETLDAGIAWLRKHAPDDTDVVLGWGDARIGNVIFDPDSLAIRAVLDWEMAAITTPEMELGWLVFFIRFWSEGMGIANPEGFPQREEVAAAYEAATGRTVRHLDFYEAFSAFKMSAIMMRAGFLMIEGGALPADSAMPYNNPTLHLLARLLGLPEPAGTAVNILDGSRANTPGASGR
jgi:aminoglycoside phosphotransferase (APT) family kinase protein